MIPEDWTATTDVIRETARTQHPSLLEGKEVRRLGGEMRKHRSVSRERG